MTSRYDVLNLKHITNASYLTFCATKTPSCNESHRLHNKCFAIMKQFSFHIDNFFGIKLTFESGND